MDRKSFSEYKRVVIKVGTAVVTSEEGYLAVGRIGHLAEQIRKLHSKGLEVILVTSGAIGLGKHRLRTQAMLSGSLRHHLDNGMPYQWDERAAAAAGQSALMALYETLFMQLGIQCSQILVMDDDFQDEGKSKSFRKTLTELLKVGILPIVNENDVMTSRNVPVIAEDNLIFWDNDSLACHVGNELRADIVILLTDVDGLYSLPPDQDPDQDVIDLFHIEESDFTIGSKSRVGRGGMQAKVDAALSAVQKRVKTVVIANGFKLDTVLSILDGEWVGTVFSKESFAKIEKELKVPPRQLAANARKASLQLQSLTTEKRRAILLELSSLLIAEQDFILKANEKDIALARLSNLDKPLLSRLELSVEKLQVLSKGIRDIANSEEPIGKLRKQTELSPGLVLKQKTSPIGVLLVIFESRPDALPQIAALAIKSGNGLLAKGGKEAFHSNNAIYSIVCRAIDANTSPLKCSGAVALVSGRSEVNQLLHLDGIIDLIIPRGSSSMVKSIQDNTKIPVMGHSEGICHIYVDADCNQEKAKRIIIDAKTDYPSACNAVETVLIHSSLAEKFTSELVQLLDDLKVTIYCGPKAFEKLYRSKASSLSHEYSGMGITIEFVDSLQEAIEHINRYGSGHTDSIVTESTGNVELFLKSVDSACVFHNCSTRFADGFRFGLGAEVGISTGRIHARGPVGVEGLLTTKWVLESSTDHCVGDFAGKLEYTHKVLPLDE